MFCKNCGTEVKYNQKFCPKCGEKCLNENINNNKSNI